MNTELNIELLAEKKVRGDLEAAERVVLEDWLAADPLHQKEFSELCEILQLTGAGLESVDPKTDGQWAELEGIISSETSQSSGKRRIRPTRVWGIAASMVLLAVVGFFLVRGMSWENPGGEIMVFSAGAQEKLVALPDQSEVRLQPGAQLILAADYNREERNVELEGKAVFKVARDAEKPFVVNAGATQTKVLGTVFELEANGDERNVELHVLSGKVSFSSPKSGAPSILTANMKGHYDAQSGEIRLDKPKAVPTDNQPETVVAKDQVLSEVLLKIEALYQVKMAIPEEYLQTRLTATFEADAEEDMIAALELILDGKFEKKDANYTFSPRP